MYIAVGNNKVDHLTNRKSDGSLPRLICLFPGFKMTLRHLWSNHTGLLRDRNRDRKQDRYYAEHFTLHRNRDRNHLQKMLV